MDIQPVVILVKPQLGSNIGASARAMANTGLSEMRLVTPCLSWLDDQTRAMSSGADYILDSAKVFNTLQEAIADLHFLYATTARFRDMNKPVTDVTEAARIAADYCSSGRRVGILFGRERWGLVNDEIALADEILTLPSSPSFSSFNLSQAVLLVSYEILRAQRTSKEREVQCDSRLLATREDMIHLFEHLETELTRAGFFFPPERKPAMVRKLRNLLHRASLDRRDVSILHAVVSALVEPHPSGERSRLSRESGKK